MIEFAFTRWDAVLVVVVTLQSLAMAYAESPKWKRLFLTLPLPFTVIVLSVGRPIDGSNFLSILVLFAYTQLCRVLHARLGTPIVFTIALGVAFYTVTGFVLADLVPTGDRAFWIGSIIIVAIGFALHFALKRVDETPIRTTLPLRAKLPLLLAVSTLLVLLKNGLQGFAGFFPLVSVIAAYETRTTLWTLAKPAPILMITLTPMLIVARLVQEPYGLGTGMAAGWIAFLFALLPFWLSEKNTIEQNKM